MTPSSIPAIERSALKRAHAGLLLVLPITLLLREPAVWGSAQT
jgi:hypothetical protein